MGSSSDSSDDGSSEESYSESEEEWFTENLIKKPKLHNRLILIFYFRKYDLIGNYIFIKKKKNISFFKK